MTEYIERESLINHVEDLPTWGTDGDMLDRQDVIGSIENRPAADVAPVRHGKWIMPLLMADGHIHGECSHCHKIRIIDDYCSACGAIMDLED